MTLLVGGVLFLVVTVLATTFAPLVACPENWNNSDLPEDLPSQDLRLGGQAAALEVRQPEAPAAKLLSENAVLLTHVFNQVQLLSVDPTGHGDQEKRPGFGFHLAHRTSYRRPFQFWHSTG
jgi:hypothetical protein